MWHKQRTFADCILRVCRPHFLHVTNRSSNINVEGLNVWNVPMRFFRIDGNSTNLDYRNLNLTVRDQYGVGGSAVMESETFGFEIADATNVNIDSITMDFRSSGPVRGGTPGGGIGVCTAIDRGTKDITMKNIDCARAIIGVAVMIGTSDASALDENNGRPRPTGHDVQNIYIKNMTYGSGINGWATGWKNSIDFRDNKMVNVTWEDVTIQSGTPVMQDDCYLRCHCVTTHHIQCEEWGWIPSFEEVRFKNFQGAVGTVPSPGSGCAANQTMCDIKFEGWGSSLSST
jgi:galacturan 1,4-alpha-galacturonidase